MMMFRTNLFLFRHDVDSFSAFGISVVEMVCVALHHRIRLHEISHVDGFSAFVVSVVETECVALHRIADYQGCFSEHSIFLVVDVFVFSASAGETGCVALLRRVFHSYNLLICRVDDLVAFAISAVESKRAYLLRILGSLEFSLVVVGISVLSTFVVVEEMECVALPRMIHFQESLCELVTSAMEMGRVDLRGAMFHFFGLSISPC